MTEQEKQILQEWARKAKEAQERREAFRKRDTERLLQLSNEAIGSACKALFAVQLGDYAPWKEEENEEAWEAYDLMLSLVYEDWKCDADE